MGRYVLTPAIFECIERVPPGRGGEIQLTDAMSLLIEREPLWGLPFTDGRYDTGNKLDWLRATVELALKREDLGPGFRKYLADLAKREGLDVIPAEEARAFVLASCARVHPKALPLARRLGLRDVGAARRARGRAALRNTAMDGYAVRAADTSGASAATPVRLEVAGLLAAGAAPTIEVAAGHAVRIMTGAAMPAGADAVVMVEETEATDDDGVLVSGRSRPATRCERRGATSHEATECSSRRR